MKPEKIIIAVMAGFVSGFVAGILLAPDKGSETRRKISEKIDSSTSGLMEFYDDMLTEVVQRIDTMIEKRTDISLHP